MHYSELTSKTGRKQSLQNIIRHFNLKRGLQVGALQGFFSSDLLEVGLERLTDVDIVKLPCISSIEEQFPERYAFIQKDSIEASKLFEDKSLDLVYLDGDHSFDYVYDELRAWWPKIRNGGILSGHDFIEYVHPELGPYGVVEAVAQFTFENSLDFWINGLTSTQLCDIMVRANEIGAQQKQVELGQRHDHVEIPNFFILKV